MVQHFYRRSGEQSEYCFNVETNAPLSDQELDILKWILAETFAPQDFGLKPFLPGSPEKPVIEIGPLLNFATAWNTNALSILRTCGIDKVTRLERSRRLVVDTDKLAGLYDQMTEGIYHYPLKNFAINRDVEPVYTIPLTQEGPEALLKIPGLSMDLSDAQFYYHYFVEQEGRNPTIVEIMDLNNANSEHSRHGYFRGRQVIDGQLMPETLMDIVKSTLQANPSNSILAFKDNSSGIRGFDCWVLVPQSPYEPSSLELQRLTYHFLFTAETHNFPTGIAPFPGAETGTGGRIRDIKAAGRGGIVVAGTTGYFVPNLYLPAYRLPWEKPGVSPSNLASGLKILIEGSDGTSNYGNTFGEPVICGTVASVDITLPDGERQAYLKPILFTGGLGLIDSRHVEKNEATAGLLIVQIGGPAYRIGFGGGAASSFNQGDNSAILDFNAVQRGDGEMARKGNNVIRACIAMGDNNPIVSIHDQGAGGPANVLKELVEKTGGTIDIRKINVGDPTMSVVEIWICEYQERNGLLIHPDRLLELQAICTREKINCEVLGEVTGDGYFKVVDSSDNTVPVNLNLAEVLGNLPQKTFSDVHLERILEPLQLPADLSMERALDSVLRLLSVGSKDFLTRKVDRSVTGKIAQQPCCGPLQLTVADVAVITQSLFPNNRREFSGAATAIGEKHLEMIINPRAAARMTVAEMLTNLASALITNLSDVKCSGNWMWAPKQKGEGARLYDAALALRDIMVYLGIAIDGGKDSLSMVTRTEENGEVKYVKSPSQLILSAYAPMNDVSKKVTPDIKHPADSRLIHIDLAGGKRRLGGSALAQVHSQLGNETPDIEADDLLNGFEAVQNLLACRSIMAMHDISKGGLITTLLEMAWAGNCGLDLSLDFPKENPWPALFHEEAGWVVEVLPRDYDYVVSILDLYTVAWQYIGQTSAEKTITIRNTADDYCFRRSLSHLHQVWSETSFNIQRLQSNPDCASEARYHNSNRPGLSFENLRPVPVVNRKIWKSDLPVAIIREEGSNGHEEMAAAFHWAGFNPVDVHMTDLINGRADLRHFRVATFVGGFSYADVLDSAKGWAATIRFNKQLRQMFTEFYERPDTLSLGVCNGAQLEMLLGWVPVEHLDDVDQPRFIQNNSQKFESHFLNVKILNSPADYTWLDDLVGSRLGVWVAHGEGQAYFNEWVFGKIIANKLAPIRYVNDHGQPTAKYPFNPNGSALGMTGFCNSDGRHLAMMPHPERSFLRYQWPYWPAEWFKETKQLASPWLRLFINAHRWCDPEFKLWYDALEQ